MNALIDFLDKLESNKIYYKLNKVREGIMVEVAVPGERWEVEFFSEGDVQIEKFISEGEIFNATEIDVLFRKFSD